MGGRGQWLLKHKKYKNYRRKQGLQTCNSNNTCFIPAIFFRLASTVAIGDAQKYILEAVAHELHQGAYVNSSQTGFHCVLLETTFSVLDKY